jgi:hypothetical protein
MKRTPTRRLNLNIWYSALLELIQNLVPPRVPHAKLVSRAASRQHSWTWQSALLDFTAQQAWQRLPMPLNAMRATFVLKDHPTSFHALQGRSTGMFNNQA